MSIVLNRFKKFVNRLNNLEFNTKTNFLMFLMISGMLSIIMLSQIALFSLKYDGDKLYESYMTSLFQLEEIKDIYQVNIYDTLYDLQVKNLEYSQAKEVIESAKNLIDRHWNRYNLGLKELPTPIYSLTAITKYFIDDEDNKEFEIMQRQLINNINTRMHKIHQIMDEILKRQYSYKPFLQDLYIDISSIKIYLTNLISLNFKKAASEKYHTEKIFYIVVTILFICIGWIFMVSIIFTFFIIHNFRNLHNSLEEKVLQKTQELLLLNKSLEKKIRKEVENNRKKDRVMFQQAKLASLGEMLQNIAHQWRQPLGSLSMILQAFQTKNILGKLTPEFIDQKVSNGLLIADNMSHTIDDFRNFFNPDKERSSFNLNKCIKHALELLKYVFKQNNIIIYEHIESNSNIIISGYYNELSHVFLNILNNAIDALKKVNFKEKYIRIAVKKYKNSVMVSIIDNGGGINKKIISQVFEPYFTTNYKSAGTGIGLYMSQQIVEKHMEGIIRVRNIKYKFGTNVIYNCAKIIIIIPIENKEAKNE